MNLNINKLTTWIGLGTLGLITACGGNNNCPLKDFAPNEIIGTYQKIYNNEPLNAQAQRFAIYLDYSGSVKTAFKDANTQQFYQLFINSLKISTVDFFEVNNFSVDKIDNLEKSQLYKKVKDASKFKGDNAPLNKTVEQIVANNTEAVFITDGELWENGERDDPWAREEFEKWLKNGNKLEFFVTNHLDGGKQKHLFYICFVPKNTESAVASDFKFYLDNSVEAKNFQYSYFSFSNNTTKITKADYQLKTGGLNENTFMDETVYINQPDYEFISLSSSWKDLFKYIANAYDKNGNPIKGGAPLLSRLGVDVSGLEFYDVNNLSVKVYNISDDFHKLKRIMEVKENTPTFWTDENGEIVLDENRQKTVICPGDWEGYNDKGELVMDTVFKTSKGLPVIEGLLTLDQEKLADFKSQKKGEVNLKLSQNFSGSMSESDYNLLRVDICLSGVTVNTSNINFQNFIWQGKQVKENRSMYNSILGALNAANPEGKVVYTYYINTLPYKN